MIYFKSTGFIEYQEAARMCYHHCSPQHFIYDIHTILLANLNSQNKNLHDNHTQ